MKNGATTAPCQLIIPLYCTEFSSLTWTPGRAISECHRIRLHYHAGKLDLGDNCGELVEDVQVSLCDVRNAGGVDCLSDAFVLIHARSKSVSDSI